MWTIFKVSIEFVKILFVFCVLFFLPPGMWNLGSPDRDETALSALEDEILNTGPPGKSPDQDTYHFWAPVYLSRV